MTEKMYAKASACFLLSLLLMLAASFPAYAEEPFGEFSLSVSYTPSESDIKCGQPVIFTAAANNADPSKCRYLMAGILNADTGENIVDPTRYSYQNSSSFSFTFCASGRYRIMFYVMEDLGEQASPRFRTARKDVYITINDSAAPSTDAVAQEIVRECNANCNSDYEKALWLHDWIIDNCEYDNSLIYSGAENALIRGIGTCEAYHGAYALLLEKAGLLSGRMTGNGHAWTAVKMDGEWYQVDTTWDDPGYASASDYERHLYFGLPDEILQMVHSDHRPQVGYESNAYDNNYFIKTGEIKQWADPFIPQIEQQLAAAAEQFSFSVDSPMPDNYKNVLYSLSAYYLSQLRWEADARPVRLEASYSNGTMRFSVQYASFPEEDYAVSLTPPPGYAGNAVWVDGIEYPASSQAGQSSVVLQNGGARTAVMYRYDASGIPTGMFVWKLEFSDGIYKPVALNGMEDLISYHGFSIRVQAPAGIRFKSGIDANVKERLRSAGIDGYRLVEYGTLRMSDARRPQYPFIKGGTGVRGGRSYWVENGVLNDAVFETVNGRARFSSVLINMPPSAYSAAQAFRAYIILTDGKDTITIYGPPVARSIYTVARQIMARGEFVPGSSGYAYIESIIQVAEN